MFVDTTFCIDLLRESVRGSVGPATAKLGSLGNRTLYASVFVLCELHAGARMSSHPRRELHRVQLLTENLAVVYPDATFAVSYGEIESYLRLHGIPVPTMDLLIGATSKIHGLPLVTRDIEHYTRIPGLVLESY